MNWALLIREIRMARGLKQEAAAEIFGVSQATLSRWERNIVKPTIGMQHRILKAMREIEPVDAIEKSVGVQAACRFITAASNGDTASIKEFLDQGFDVNCKDYDDRTALHLAASEGHVETVSVLLANGADVEQRDRWGNTPRDAAIESGHGEIASLMEETLKVAS